VFYLRKDVAFNFWNLHANELLNSLYRLIELLHEDEMQILIFIHDLGQFAILQLKVLKVMTLGPNPTFDHVL